MQNLIQLIEKYVLYLITDCFLSVTIHPMEKENLITSSPLMRFNIHSNSYCAYIKANQKGYTQCHLQQKKVLKKCQKTEEDFCGTCHAGVFEYVYPLFNEKRVIGFISVSGYSCENGKARIPKVAEQLGCSKESLMKNYETLSSKLPEKEKLDTLILPLCKMIELAYRTEANGINDETLITQICRYIHQNYADDLTTEKICCHFFVVAHISAISSKKKPEKAFGNI